MPKSYELRRSPIHGTGVFATRRLRPGTRIIEYLGERIDQEEADRRYDDDAMAQHHTFLFTVDDDEILDAGVGGNEARFINHSCDPNCEAFVEDGRIFIYAKKNIQPGTELTYDYKLERTGRYRKHWLDLYACRCGSPKCRGTVLRRKDAQRAARAARRKAQGRAAGGRRRATAPAA